MGNLNSLPPQDEFQRRMTKHQNDLVLLNCKCKRSLPQPVIDRYWRCSLDAWEKIYRACEDNLKKSRRETLGLVLDIDDTVLWCACPRCSTVDRRIQTLNPLPVRPLLELFKLVKAAGVLVCFISARKDSQRYITESQLQSAGFSGFTELVLLSALGVAEKKLESTAGILEYKIAARHHFSKKHDVRVVATIGDQPWDLAGPDKITGFRILLREPLANDYNGSTDDVSAITSCLCLMEDTMNNNNNNNNNTATATAASSSSSSSSRTSTASTTENDVTPRNLNDTTTPRCTDENCEYYHEYQLKQQQKICKDKDCPDC